jgi:hypothetical protein
MSRADRSPTRRLIASQTVNALNAGVLRPLDRTTVDGEAQTLSTNLNFVSRPSSWADFSARYRTYDYDNKTPPFAMTQRVSYDNAPGIASMSTLGGVSVPYRSPSTRSRSGSAGTRSTWTSG